MFDVKKLRPDTQTMPIYLLVMAFVLLGCALRIAGKADYSVALAVAALLVSLVLFTLVLLNVPKTVQPAIEVVQKAVPEPELAQGQSTGKPELAPPVSMKVEHAAPDMSVSEHPRAIKVTEIQKTCETKSALEIRPENRDVGSQLKLLMNTPLGEILVAGLLNNPDNVARIIVQAVSAAHSEPNSHAIFPSEPAKIKTQTAFPVLLP